MLKFLPVFFLLPMMTLGQSGRDHTLPDWAFGGFVRPAGVNPIISPDTTTSFFDPVLKKKVAWESNDTFNPGAAIKDGKVVLLYRAEDRSGVGIGYRTSRLGYAESSDGVAFSRKNKPVFYPANDDQKKFEWPGGCEDPRLSVTEDGTYLVFYTQWNRKLPRLGVATSKDLVHWKKHGPIFEQASKGHVFDVAHKSASIVTAIKDGRQVIARINRKYWMYWGELGVYAATSDNLTDWEPLVDAAGQPRPLISPREGFFDSHLTECGPPAIVTSKGILLLYNGKNLGDDRRDKRFPANTYSAGQVLFDANDPAKPLERLDLPFFRPMEPFEKTGQYAAGTVFIEGMAFFRDKWYLYYGCADSKVGVAIYDPASPAPPDPLP